MTNFVGGRGTGKTKKLIALAKELNATVVCENPERMFRKMQGYDVYNLSCITYADFIQLVKEGMYGGNYVIDEVEGFVKEFCPAVAGFTAVAD